MGIVLPVCGGAFALGFLSLAGLLIWANWAAARDRRYAEDHGRAVTAWIVQANRALFRPDDRDLPAMTIFSFDPAVGDDEDYMLGLCEKIAGLKGTTPADPDERVVAGLVTDEAYRPGVRWDLPASVTGGPAVAVMHLMVERVLLPDRVLDAPAVRAVTVPAEPRRGLHMVRAPRHG